MKIHTKENNAESEKHLRLYRKHFTRDAANVCYLLVSKEYLTVKGCILNGTSGHLPRRILDIKEFGIDVSDKWVKLNNGKRFKVYYMTPEQIKAAKKLLTKKK